MLRLREPKNENDNGPENNYGFCSMTDFEKEDMDTLQHSLNLGIKVRSAGNTIPMTFAVTDKIFIATVQEVKIHGWVNKALATNDPNYITHYDVLFEELWNKGCDSL